MASRASDIRRYLERIDRASPVEVRGRVKEVVGLVVKAVVPEAWIGEMCLIRNPRSPAPVKAEVVGFKDGDVLLTHNARVGTAHRPAHLLAVWDDPPP